MVAAAECEVNGVGVIGGTTNGVKGQTVDYDNFFSEEAKKRILPGLRALATQSRDIPGILPMNAGLPPMDSFPIQNIQMTLTDGTKVEIKDTEVKEAQQYNLTLRGHGTLLPWVEEHVRRLHAPAAGHETIITSGSNNAIEVVIRMFLNPGDALLCEEYTYPHVPESMLDPLGFKTVPIKMDNEGLIPEHLEATLSSMQAKGETLPKLLYTIPVGQNPTGASTGLQRKEQIYAICRRFNILILEDDPYFYLQFEAGKPPKGLRDLCPSYLSMDCDLRVIRLDSFSKVLAPGFRLGWITAQRAVVDKFIYHLHGVPMGASSLSQVVMGAMLQKIGHEGFEAHLKRVQEKYVRKAEVISRAAEKHLKGLAEWGPVTAGMFMWLRLIGIKDADEVLPAIMAQKVIVVPGRLAWHTYPNVEGVECPAIRLSYVTATEEQLEEGVAKIGAVLRNHVQLQKPLNSSLINQTPTAIRAVAN